jgi:hypothetical protein
LHVSFVPEDEDEGRWATLTDLKTNSVETNEKVHCPPHRCQHPLQIEYLTVRNTGIKISRHYSLLVFGLGVKQTLGAK